MWDEMGPQFEAGLLSVIRLSVWLALLVVIFVPLEHLFAAQPSRVLRKGILTDVCYYFLNNLTTAAFLSVPAAILALAARQATPQVLLTWSTELPFWGRAALAFVAGEIGYYWGHRLCHEIPILWRFHSIHHSAEHVDFLVNTRAHPFDMVFSRFCGLVPIYVLGFSGSATSATDLTSAAVARDNLIPIVATLIGTIWGFFIHANLKWRFGPLEWLVTTPAFHHWHHTLTPINKNYSSTLPWIDRIFGTHFLPKNEFPSQYGIDSPMPDSILDQLAFPLDSPSSKRNVESTAVPSLKSSTPMNCIDIHEKTRTV